MYPHSIHTNIVTTDLVNSAVAQSVVITPECLSHLSVIINLIKQFVPSFFFSKILFTKLWYMSYSSTI